MSVKDFEPRPQGAKADSHEFMAWVDRLRNRQNIDDQIEVTFPAPADEMILFDVSENAIRKICICNLISFFTQTASVTIASSNSETTILGAGEGSLILPANNFIVGETIRILASGYYSTAAAPPTMRMRVYLNSTVILDTGANALANGITDLHWSIPSADITCRTIGTTGSVMSQGQVIYSTSHGAATVDDFTPNKTAIQINTTIAQTLNVTVQWGTSSSSNSITCTNLNLTNA